MMLQQYKAIMVGDLFYKDSVQRIIDNGEYTFVSDVYKASLWSMNVDMDRLKAIAKRCKGTIGMVTMKFLPDDQAVTYGCGKPVGEEQ